MYTKEALIQRRTQLAAEVSQIEQRLILLECLCGQSAVLLARSHALRAHSNDLITWSASLRQQVQARVQSSALEMPHARHRDRIEQP